METIRCKNNFGQKVEIPRDKFCFRPSVYGIAIHNGKILVMDTKSTGKLWLPGGKVGLGERLAEALEREFQEETGLKLKQVGNLLFSGENFYFHEPTNDAMHAFVFFYLCEVELGDISDNGMEEGEDAENVRWLAWSEIKKIGFTDFHNELIGILDKLIIT